eukprot:9605949-Lingulodinium_polyedra.AAC.1
MESITYHEIGCCKSVMDAKLKVYAAIQRAELLLGSDVDLPCARQCRAQFSASPALVKSEAKLKPDPTSA